MTVLSTKSSITYTASGTGTTFPYDFRIFEKTDLIVYDEGVLQVVDVDYYVTGVGLTGGGNVVFYTAPLAGHIIIIRRVLPLTQGHDYQEGDPFPAETHETNLDRLVMIAQQFLEAMERFLKLPDTSTLTDIEIPVGAGKAIKWNALATNFELFTVDVGSTSVITTKGDMIYGETGGVPERKPIGNTGDILRVASNIPDWEPPASFKLDDWGIPDDNTDLDVSITRHGLVPKLPNNSKKFFRGDGGYGYHSVRGSISNLKIEPAPGTGPSSSQLVITADSVVMENASNEYYEAISPSILLDISTSGANGLDTGTLANGTWYFIYLILNPTIMDVATLISLSSTAPTMPSGYTYKKLIGVFRNVGRVSHLHMDGTDEGQTFTDQSGKTWTARNHANTEQSDKKFGTTSAEFDGTDDWIDTPDHADFDLLNKDFTIEFFVHRLAAGALHHLCGHGNAGVATSGWGIDVTAANNLVGYVSNGAAMVATTNIAFSDTASWHHIALVRKGALLTMFLDGVKSTPVAFPGSCPGASTILAVGQWGTTAASYLNGRIDEFSITVGLAKYWEDFTPPTAALGNICQILPFIQIDKEVQLSYPHRLADDAGTTTTASISLSAVVPTIAKGVHGKVVANTGAANWFVSPRTFPNSLGTDNNFTIGFGLQAAAMGLQWFIPILEESQTIYHQVSANTVDVWVYGYDLKGI